MANAAISSISSSACSSSWWTTTIARSGSSRAIASATSRRATAISVGVVAQVAHTRAVLASAAASSSARGSAAADLVVVCPHVPPCESRSPYRGTLRASAAELPPRRLAPQQPGARCRPPSRRMLDRELHQPRGYRAHASPARDRGSARPSSEPGRGSSRAERGPRAVRALPRQARPRRPRDARRALPAARAPARAPLPAPRGAASTTSSRSRRLGLVKAIDRFDLEREVAFSSYAVPTILGEIKRYFRDRTWSVRVPRDLQELALKVDRAVAELSLDLHRQPTVDRDRRERRRRGGGRPRGARGVGRLQGDVAGGAARRRGRRRRHARRHASAPRSTASRSPRTARRSSASCARSRRASARSCACASSEDLTQAEIGERIGVSQMQVSRIIRQSIARLRAYADARRRPARGLA